MKINRKTRRAAKRLFRLCLKDGLLDEARMRDVVQALADSGRRNSLPILSHLRRLIKLDRKRHSAVVESAIGLPDDLRNQLQQSLAQMYGRGVDVLFRQTPALIAGVRVKVASDVFDGSVQAKLAALEASFGNGRTVGL